MRTLPLVVCTPAAVGVVPEGHLPQSDTPGRY